MTESDSGEDSAESRSDTTEAFEVTAESNTDDSSENSATSNDNSAAEKNPATRVDMADTYDAVCVNRRTSRRFDCIYHAQEKSSGR